ncbi:MAG: hypothetical protein ACR2IH_10420 [Pyrinomonadaceae bacterium]
MKIHDFLLWKDDVLYRNLDAYKEKTGRKIAADLANIYVSLPVYAQSTIIFNVKHPVSRRALSFAQRSDRQLARLPLSAQIDNALCAIGWFATSNNALLVLSFAAKRP